MPEVNKIVSRALRLLRVIDPNESPEAEQMAGAIEALNGMMRRWEANGLSLGWSDVSVPSDEVPAPDEAIDAIVFNLATKLRPEYGAALEQDVYINADQGLSALRRDIKVANPMSWDRRGTEYNIRTDQYD